MRHRSFPGIDISFTCTRQHFVNLAGTVAAFRELPTLSFALKLVVADIVKATGTGLKTGKIPRNLQYGIQEQDLEGTGLQEEIRVCAGERALVMDPLSTMRSTGRIEQRSRIVSLVGSGDKVIQLALWAMTSPLLR